MPLKEKGYCLGVLLIYTITTITLPSVGWCEPTVYPPRPISHLTPHNGRNGALRTRGLTHLSDRGGRKRLRLDSRQKKESPHFLDFHYLDNRDGIETQSSGGMSEESLKPRMESTANDRSFKNREKLKQTEGEWVYTSLTRPGEDCSTGKIQHVIHGKFYITGQLDLNIPNVGYQSDSAVSGQERIRGQRARGSGESWQRLQPVVECGDDAMTLTVRRRRAVQLLLHRVNESSVPLSQLPPQCGYSVQTTWRDLNLVAQYDACHVTQEDDSYVLALLWRGTPVKMSCPASHVQPQVMEPPSPPSLCCSPYGMTIKVQGLSATEELRVNVRGEWTPLVLLAEKCGCTLDRQDAEIVITAPFITCGITVKDGTHTLSLQVGGKTFTLACPVSPPGEPPLSHQPLVNSPQRLTRRPTEPMPESLEPFPWTPPFYLAPPYYPHPTYRYKYSSLDGSNAYNPPAPSTPTPQPTFGPQPLPPVDSQTDYQDYYPFQIPVGESYKHFGARDSLSAADDLEDSSQVYPDLQQKETTILGLSEKRSATHSLSSDTSFPVQDEAPPLQPPSHAFSQYYHYYHHPKIPLPGPPQDLDPGPQVPSLTNPHNPEFPVLLPSVLQSEALSRFNSDQVFQPVSEATSHPYTPPKSAPYTPYPPLSYPYHYIYYFPHIARGEAKRLSPLNPNAAAKTNLSDHQNTKSSTFVHPLPRSSAVHDEHNLNPHTDQPNSDKMIPFLKNIPEWIKRPLLSEDDGVKAVLDDGKRPSAVRPPLQPGYSPGPDSVAVPPPEQPSIPTPSPNHNHHLYPYYYHHPYHYYQMYYRPESLLSAENPPSPTSSKEEALDLLLQSSSSPPQHPSYRKPQTTTPPTESIDNVYLGPLHPYYYYYPHPYQPIVSVHNQEVHSGGSMNSESETQLPSDSDYSRTGWLAHAAEAGYPSTPLSNPFNSLFYYDITQQHPHNPSGHPDGGEEAEERLDNEITDRLEANLYTPSASPCGLGPVSDLDCIVSLGCCLYPVKDRVMGQHLVFVVPDSVLEPSVAPATHPSEVSNVSCTLQRLTSDSNFYIVPLNGCGVNKHVFDQTAVYLLEVHGIHSLQHDHSSVHEDSPVSSSPGSPGEVRLHMRDQPPPPAIQSTPATVTVQLRIATDESFASFHPEARLPLSVIRGRPVYVEVSMLDPPEPGLVLLVHSCLAYTQAPYTSWMLIYDGCPSQGDSQLLPSTHADHIRRIVISSFLSLPSESAIYRANRGYSDLEDLEIYFLCLTDVCSAAGGDCTVGCINSKFNIVKMPKEKLSAPVLY